MARSSNRQDRGLSAGDVRHVLGDEDEFSTANTAPSKHRSQQSTGRTGKGTPEFSKDEVVTEGKAALEAMAIGSTFFDLAHLFKTQPWVHTYRGDTEALPTLKVAMGEKLLARLLSEQARSDARLKEMDDAAICETVEYAMKHFFARVPNDERGSNLLVNRFLHEDWWDALIPEAVDHFKMLRTPMPSWEDSQRAVEAYYANWPKKETSNRPKTVKEAAARFNEMYAKYLADQEAEYALLDEEPLT